MFIVLISLTCKCLLNHGTDNLQQRNSMWGKFKLVKPKHETKLHLVRASWFNFQAIFNVATTFTNFSRYRKYKLGISVFCLSFSLRVFFEWRKCLNQLSLHLQK